MQIYIQKKVLCKTKYYKSLFIDYQSLYGSLNAVQPLISCYFYPPNNISLMISPRQINAFTFLKLPSCWWSGVRCKSIYSEKCVVNVTHNWFNKNPFESIYFAVQSMAAELTTGALLMYHIKRYNANMSMLVISNESSFSKKARGKIEFFCIDGPIIKAAVKKAISTKEPQKIWIESRARNQVGEEVSHFRFEWSIKLKRKN